MLQGKRCRETTNCSEMSDKTVTQLNERKFRLNREWALWHSMYRYVIIANITAKI